eukprot:1829133-Rhodomonas_salina.1
MKAPATPAHGFAFRTTDLERELRHGVRRVALRRGTHVLRGIGGPQDREPEVHVLVVEHAGEGKGHCSRALREDGEYRLVLAVVAAVGPVRSNALLHHSTVPVRNSDGSICCRGAVECIQAAGHRGKEAELFYEGEERRQSVRRFDQSSRVHPHDYPELLQGFEDDQRLPGIVHKIGNVRRKRVEGKRAKFAGWPGFRLVSLRSC